MRNYKTEDEIWYTKNKIKGIIFYDNEGEILEYKKESR